MRYRTLLPLLCSMLWNSASADHFAGGTISTRCLGGNFHEVTLQLFRNCGGTAMLAQTLDFSNDCGVIFQQTGLLPDTVVEVSPLCADDLPNSTCNGGSLMGFDLSTYRTTVYLSPCSRWVISWNTCCRNASLDVVGSPGLYIETTLNNLGGACNAAPSFVNDIIPLVCLDQPVSYNAGAVETDGHTLSYALIDARFGSPTPVPVQYAAGHSGAEPFDGMNIDPGTGTITFLPTEAGVVIVVVEVTETNSQGAVIGTVMRDFLFVVSPCANTVPSIESGTFTGVTGPATILGERELGICGSEEFCATITVADANIDQGLTLTSNATTVMDGATLTITGTNPITAELCWANAMPGTYHFAITATDDACPVVGSQIYNYEVAVTTAPDAGTGGSTSVCANASSFALVDSLGGSPALTGSWLDPEGNASDGVFVPGTSLGGTYTYTVGSPSCNASSTLAVVVLPGTDPACLTAGLSDASAARIRWRIDPANDHRLWLTMPAVDGHYRVLSADGKLVKEGRFVSNGMQATSVEIPTEHHGLTLLQVRDRRTGASYVLRTAVP